MTRPRFCSIPTRSRSSGSKELRDLKDPNRFLDGTMLSRKRFQDAIFTAARATYQDMVGEMQPALINALKTEEVAYYNAVAEAKQMKDRVSATSFELAIARIESENRTKFGKPSGFDS
jgi:hypothetical protein